jgi:hypothetical protein
MSTKESVIEMIRRLPDDVTVPDILTELYFRQLVDEGLAELDAGKGVSHEEAKKTAERMDQLIWSPRAIWELEVSSHRKPAFFCKRIMSERTSGTC